MITGLGEFMNKKAADPEGYRGSRMLGSRSLSLLRVALVIVVATLFLSKPGICTAFRNLEEGKEVPDFTLKDLEGLDHTLSAERGKVVILCFVKADQDRSIRALNGLTRVHGTLKDSGLAVYGIANEPEEGSTLQGLAEKLDLGYPILIDEGKKLYGSYGLFTFPATAVIDQEGRFVYEYASYSSDFEQTMMDKAKLLLGMISEEEFAQTEEKQEIQELTPEQKEAQRSLQMAKVLLGRGFGSKALPNLEKAVKLDPTLTEARILAGRVYIEEEKYPEAREQFEKVLESNPKSNDARVGIGSVLIAEGDLDGAEAELKKAITLNPDPALAMYSLGQVYEKKGEVQKAMETYRDALANQLKKAAKRK